MVPVLCCADELLTSSCNSQSFLSLILSTRSGTQSSCFVLRFIRPPWREHLGYAPFVGSNLSALPVGHCGLGVGLNNVFLDTCPPTFAVRISRPNHVLSTPSQTDDPPCPLALIPCSKAVQLCPHPPRSCLLLSSIVSAGRRPSPDHGDGPAGDWHRSSNLLCSLPT